MYNAPSPTEMFSDARDGSEVVRRFEHYKSTLADSHGTAETRGDAFIPGQGIVKGAKAGEKLAERFDKIGDLTKGLSGDALASVTSELDSMRTVVGDLQKDWTLSTPLTGGLVPYDLEAPAKLLVPRLTPLVNEIPREKGQGTALQFRRITGWSNSGIGGSANLSPFINSNSVQTSFGSQAFRRGPKIAYSADSKSVAYVEMGLSDQVNWQAEFASRGYENIRQLSQTALLWATKGGEERAMLFGRGTSGNGFTGVVSAPVLTSAVGASTGGTIGAATYSVKVTAFTGFGESVVSNEVTTAALSGSTNQITVTVGTEPTGALGYNLYVGTSTGTETFQTSFSGNVFVLKSYAGGGAAMPGADTSADANAYDGLLTVQSNPAVSGYVSRVNGKLSTTNPGVEFQTAFQSLWSSVKADPDEVLVDATVISELGDLIKTNNSTGYRIMVQGDEPGGHQLGTVVTGLQNQVTRKMVDLNLHPWMPAGNALIRSKSLPLPDSHISNTVAMRMVQDYMAVDWPVIQFTYDQSTYMYGSMVHYAPAWSGLLLGIQ